MALKTAAMAGLSGSVALEFGGRVSVSMSYLSVTLYHPAILFGESKGVFGDNGFDRAVSCFLWVQKDVGMSAMDMPSFSGCRLQGPPCGLSVKSHIK
jgi:hypothetical protein